MMLLRTASLALAFVVSTGCSGPKNKPDPTIGAKPGDSTGTLPDDPSVPAPDAPGPTDPTEPTLPGEPHAMRAAAPMMVAQATIDAGVPILDAPVRQPDAGAPPRNPTPTPTTDAGVGAPTPTPAPKPTQPVTPSPTGPITPGAPSH